MEDCSQENLAINSRALFWREVVSSPLVDQVTG